MAWTEERTRILTKLWADGWTGSEIGERLGVTRGAVVSKVHRLGLARGGKNQAPGPQPAMPSVALAPVPIPASPAPAMIMPLPGGRCYRPPGNALELEFHPGNLPASAREPDRPAIKFTVPPDNRSRYERRADLIREVERLVLHELSRLRQLGWSICGIARHTGLETGTVTALLNEAQDFPGPNVRRRKRKTRLCPPNTGSWPGDHIPLNPVPPMTSDMAGTP